MFGEKPQSKKAFDQPFDTAHIFLCLSHLREFAILSHKNKVRQILLLSNNFHEPVRELETDIESSFPPLRKIEKNIYIFDIQI